MSSSKIVCPHCHATLNAGKPVPAGTEVHCLKCKQPFCVAGGTAELTAPAKAESKPGNGLAIAIVSLFGLLLIGGGAGSAWFLFRAEAPKQEAAPKPLPEAAIARQAKNVPTSNAANPAKPDYEIPKFAVKNSKGVSEEVEDTIQKGVAFLKQSQKDSGSWAESDEQHALGYAALPGLTLLECGVQANDPVVQKAAQFTRKHATEWQFNYDVSASVLFLDRLGDPQDRNLIRKLALKIIASQTSAGGWDYKLGTLKSGDDEKYLLAYLQKHQPKAMTFVEPVGKKPEPTKTATRPPEKKPEEKKVDLKKVDSKKGDGKKVEQPKVANPLPGLPPTLKALPIIMNVGKSKGSFVLRAAKDDNSNTQFAMLALWAARRHDVASEMPILLAQQRFATGQNAKDGGWPYRPGEQTSTATMTCVGLLGLAMGYGAEIPAKKTGKDVSPRAPSSDPMIQKGLKHLEQFIKTPDPDNAPPVEDPYLLWSIERIGVLYNLKNIGKKDWYAWGSQTLIHHQKSDGSWNMREGPAIDSSLALLFLRRSNLVNDLSDNLNLFIAVGK